MAPAEGGIEGNAAALGRFPQAHTIDEGLSVGKPCIAAMELSQRRTSQCVEGLAAVFTAIALPNRSGNSSRRPTSSHSARSMAPP